MLDICIIEKVELRGQAWRLLTQFSLSFDSAGREMGRFKRSAPAKGVVKHGEP